MTRAKLKSVLVLREALEREKYQVKTLRECETNLTAMLDGLPHAAPLDSRIERFTLRIMETEKKIADLTAALVSKSALLSSALSAEIKDSLTLSVMTLRYVGCLSLSAIAERLNFSARYINRIHARGMKILGL